MRRTFPLSIFLILLSPPPNALPRDRESSAPPRWRLVQFGLHNGLSFSEEGNSIHFYNGVDVEVEMKGGQKGKKGKFGRAALRGHVLHVLISERWDLLRLVNSEKGSLKVKRRTFFASSPRTYSCCKILSIPLPPWSVFDALPPLLP